MATSRDARAADPENCLSCHRYRGLARVDDDGVTVRPYHVEPDYYDRLLGPHARLRCTDCHPREEVDIIPHLPVSPVNCTTLCHLATPGHVERRFSHDGIAGMLELSAHTSEVLERSNELLGRPLRPDQSRCLLCHDEPAWRRGEQTWVQQVAPVARCQVCHIDEPMLDTHFAFWHVHARSRPARSNEEVARVCALCHSHGGIREAFALPDSTVSYLHSFHGKAMLLGSQETAGCLDCHVGEMQNVHLMQSHRQPGSPTHPAQLPDTCRSPACHPTAGEAISSAAIHLDLSTDRGIEYGVAALFVVLIVLTFGPSVLLQSLEMLQVVVGRHDPHHHRNRALAERLMADPKGRQALKRFTSHQRVQHWVLFVAFTLLVLTGFPIKFADRDWARVLVDLMGGLSSTRLIHRWAGVLLLLGFVYHAAYVFAAAWQRKRQSGQGWLHTIYNLPMVSRVEDIRHLFQLLGFLLFIRRERPAFDRFSLKEKFEYFGVFWGTALLGVTGVLMWAHAWTTMHLTGRVLTVASLIHTFEAFLALLHVGVIHLIGVILVPAVFPLSKAMFTGDTPPEELAEAHAGMVLKTAESIQVDPGAEGGRG